MMDYRAPDIMAMLTTEVLTPIRDYLHTFFIMKTVSG
jgi:hypothetical protein